MNWTWDWNDMKFKEYNNSDRFDRSTYESVLNDLMYSNQVRKTEMKNKILDFIKDLDYTEFEELNN